MASLLLDGRILQDHFPGIGRYAFELARALAAEFPAHRFRILFDPRARNTRLALDTLSNFSNIELLPVQAGIFSMAEQRLGRNVQVIGDAALWHALYYAFPFAVKLPLVVTLGDVTPLVFHDEMPGAPKRLLYRTLNRIAGARARTVLTFSDASALELSKHLHIPRSKIHVAPLAADVTFRPAPTGEIERVRSALDLPSPYALYLGSNKPHKNLPRLIQAWSQVPTPNMLVIAGVWYDRYPEAQTLVAQLGLQDRVLFRHNVSRADLPALLSGAQLFVFPSVHEGFGLPPLEAMSCGVPVACANVSSLPEVVGDAALTFDPWHPTSITNALNTLLENSNLRQQLQAKGFLQAQSFSWERTARQTMHVYQAVIET